MRNWSPAHVNVAGNIGAILFVTNCGADNSKLENYFFMLPEGAQGSNQHLYRGQFMGRKGKSQGAEVLAKSHNCIEVKANIIGCII